MSREMEAEEWQIDTKRRNAGRRGTGQAVGAAQGEAYEGDGAPGRACHGGREERLVDGAGAPTERLSLGTEAVKPVALEEMVHAILCFGGTCAP